MRERGKGERGWGVWVCSGGDVAACEWVREREEVRCQKGVGWGDVEGKIEMGEIGGRMMECFHVRLSFSLYSGCYPPISGAVTTR